MPALLREHGILLLTSRYEASPTVVKEALRVDAAGGQHRCRRRRRLAGEGRTGFIRPHDAEELAGAVRAATRLILRGGYGCASPTETLDERAIMNQVLRLYRWLAAG